MITVECAASGARATFESADQAIERNWLKVTARPTAGRSIARVFWFAPDQAGQWAATLIREGVTTREELATAGDQFMREGRILE